MEQKKQTKFIMGKREIGKIVLCLIIAIIMLTSLKAIATTIIAGSAEVIEDEKTIVRTAATISRRKSGYDKVDIAILSSELGKYASTTVTQLSSEIIQVTFSKTGNIYKININQGPTFDATGEIPYLPVGYTPVENTDLETGFVIEDKKGNQFVWVEVPRTITVYPTAGINITEFSSAEYDQIEADLHTYTSVYRNGTTYTDTWSSEDATGLTQEEYDNQKKKMLKSIYKNGGFYVGRFETGIENEIVHIKPNKAPGHSLVPSDAQELSENFSTSGYTASLMFGVQWDLMLKYIESKGTSQSNLVGDSSSWGNYGGSSTLTGSTDEFSKQNIYDIAGNQREYTLEFSGNVNYPVSRRGGWYGVSGTVAPASDRYCLNGNGYGGGSEGFRVALYKDEIIPTPTTPTTYTITYNNNGRGTAPEAQIATIGVATTLSTTTPVATGYTFLGWATSSTATTAEYAVGASYTGNEDVTLYAVWQINNNCTITLHAMGGKFPNSKEIMTFTAPSGTSASLPTSGVTRNNYTLLGWSSNSTDTLPEYPVTGNNNIVVTSDITLYAVWGTFTGTMGSLALHANGGQFSSGVESNNLGSTIPLGTNVTLPPTTATAYIPIKSGYGFMGWATVPDATVAEYNPGATINIQKDVILYAVWKKAN